MKDAYRFWKNVDVACNGMSLTSLSEKSGVNYRTMVNQRSINRMPSLYDAYLLAGALGVSIEFLMTGIKKDAPIFPSRIMAIARACEKADEMTLVMVERVLGLPEEGKNTEIQGLA